MILLPNGCHCSKLTVHPKNWQIKTADACIKWYISYRFYDPKVTDPSGKIKPKQVVIKGMNVFYELATKQQATKKLYENEFRLLKECEYNPITGHCIVSKEENDFEIHPDSLVPAALSEALKKITVEPHTKEDIESVLKYFSKSWEQLGYDNLAIKDVRRRHVRYTLDNCKNCIKKNGKKKIWNENQFNHYRKYLNILFAELEELEAIEENPVIGIKKKESTKKIRATLSAAERDMVNKYLQQKHYIFWRFMQIFFHSGARETELANLKFCDVELHNQRYKVIIKKGNSKRERWKTIKDIALPLWNEIMQHGEEDDYVFGLGFKPGKIKLRTNLISIYWLKLIKKPFGIKADFYSLKHSNTSETVSALNDSDAAAMNSHKSTAMVVKIYDVDREARQHERLKKVNNSFSDE